MRSPFARCLFVAAISTSHLLQACGEAPPRPDVAAAIDPVPISGLYDVAGFTRPVKGPDRGRKIAGTLTLQEDAGHYTATFKLETTFPGAEDPVQADVIGSGDGTVDGRTLRGTTKTQLVVSTVPGVDTDFAFIPRMVGARVVSTSVTVINPDGSVVIELENRPDEGDDYTPTTTRLTGHRVADSALAAARAINAPSATATASK
jgi:hypothetical protein